MKSLLGGSPLFRKIMLSILLASMFFLSLLTIVVYYSNEILEDELLAKQTDFELKNIQNLLNQDPDTSLPVQPASAFTSPAGRTHDRSQSTS